MMNSAGKRLSDLEGRCLDQGFTITWQRHRILAIVAAAKAPMDVDQVWHAVRRAGQGVGRNTVNRMLGLMSEAGVIEMSYSETGRRVFR